MLKTILRKLGHIGIAFWVFTYIIFEELVWETIAKPIYEYVHSLKILKRVEALIHKLHRIVLLITFLILFIQVELLGFVAVALIAKGQVYSGVILYLGKIPIGAFTFWLFRISKDKLMTFGWFKAIYDFIMGIIDKIKASEIYRDIKIKSSIIKKYIKTNVLQKSRKVKEKIKKIWLRISK
jgi:hypothetical protein